MPIEVIKVKKSPYYQLRGTYRGVYIYKTTKTSNRKIADELRKETEDEIDAKGKTRTAHTFSDAVDRYLESGGSERYLTAADMLDKKTDNWKPGIMQQFSDIHLDRLDQIALDVAAKQAFPNFKPQTLNRHFYTPFIAVMNHAAQDGLCDFRKWRRPRQTRAKRRKWFSYEDAAKFYQHAPEHLKAIFVFCVYTGARITETIELEIKDINLESKWAVLNASKTDAFRGVPLHHALINEISEYWDYRAWKHHFRDLAKMVILAQSGEPYIPHRKDDGTVQGGGYFKTAWKTTLKNAGLDGYTPYSMRHTFNNWLIMAGIDQATREALMGHDNGSTNAMYSDAPQSHLIEAVEKLKDFTVHGFSTPILVNS